MKQILLTGANRGIGLELTRQLLARGERVFAGCRRPEEAVHLQAVAESYPKRLTILQLDVTDDDSVQAARAAVGQETDRLDWLVNNAGILVRGESLSNFDPAIMSRTLDVNVTGPMRVTAAFVDLLRQGQEPKLLNMSSQLGSLHQARPNGLFSYNASKAALNMVTRMLAQDLASAGITVIAIHPGWAQTDMGGIRATLPVPDSAAGIIHLASRLTTADSNKFFTYDGQKHTW